MQRDTEGVRHRARQVGGRHGDQQTIGQTGESETDILAVGQRHDSAFEGEQQGSGGTMANVVLKRGRRSKAGREVGGDIAAILSCDC